ncbi:MAG TPA: hypothetical protein VGL39_27860 [Jatrophihabitantaceae bacterium]|jgi:hypothetical protein
MPSIPTGCEQCGQFDDHPKVHYGGRTWHHDCTPAPVKAEILAGAHSVSADVTAAVFAACEGGLRGHELRAHILTMHEEG